MFYKTDNSLIRIIEKNALTGEYVYNGRGQRMIKKVGGETLYFHYDMAGNIICTSDIYGSLKEKYVYVNGQRLAKINVTHEPMDVGDVDGNGFVETADADLIEKSLVGLVTLTDTQKTHAPGPTKETIAYYHNDHLGTPVALTDRTGVQVWGTDNLPFGGVYQDTGSENQRFRFPGQYYDSETGLHYNWNRYYDPGTGRYLTADPIGLDGGINLYSYVLNDPVNWIDPFGLIKIPGITDTPVFVCAFGKPA